MRAQWNWKFSNWSNIYIYVRVYRYDSCIGSIYIFDLFGISLLLHGHVEICVLCCGDCFDSSIKINKFKNFIFQLNRKQQQTTWIKLINNNATPCWIDIFDWQHLVLDCLIGKLVVYDNIFNKYILYCVIIIREQGKCELCQIIHWDLLRVGDEQQSEKKIITNSQIAFETDWFVVKFEQKKKIQSNLSVAARNWSMHWTLNYSRYGNIVLKIETEKKRCGWTICHLRLNSCI